LKILKIGSKTNIISKIFFGTLLLNRSLNDIRDDICLFLRKKIAVTILVDIIYGMNEKRTVCPPDERRMNSTFRAILSSSLLLRRLAQ